MKTTNGELAINILELLRTGSDAMEFIKHQHSSGSINQVTYLFIELKVLFATVQRTVESFDYEIPLTRLPEIVNNLNNIIDNIQILIAENDIQCIDFDIRLLLPALFQLLKNEVAYLLENFVDKVGFTDFYPELIPVDKNEVIEEIAKSKALISLVILAYNKLDYTKQCVESILEYTRNCDYELILVNNGSTDGTAEYFNSFPSAKKIHLNSNIGATLGFNIGMMVAEGRYVAALGNDIIFTHNWLSNLINCIESDDSFGYVAPAATYMSNYQQIDVEFREIEEFQEYARKYNISDPSKWEERIILMPTALLIPTPLIKRINYFDVRYYYGEFADDDISFKIRRSGFKCIYCKDTLIHHFGHVTVGHDQQANKSLAVSKLIFKQKYGLDAWEDGRFDLNLVNMTDFNVEVKSILGIDTKCGGTPLQIKNFLKSKGQNRIELSLFTTEDKYLTDLKTITDKVVFDTEISKLSMHYQAEQFDLVLIETPIDEYDEISLKRMLFVLKAVLKKGGQLLLKINNPSFYHNIYNLLQGESDSTTVSKLYTTNHIKNSILVLGFSRMHISFVKVPDNSTFSDMIAGIFQDSDTQDNTKQLLLTKEIMYRIT